MGATPMEDLPQVPQPHGAYLVTGGLGGLGLEIGEWLCKSRGVSELILSSRRPRTSRTESPRLHRKLQSMEKWNCSVTLHSGDISKQETVQRLLDEIPRLTGIVHAAGILGDESILNVTWDSFMSVFAPKAIGAHWLHMASDQQNQQNQPATLKDFVLMSSTAALGARHLTSYASANSFLDGLATLRRQAGLVGLSINWGPWAEVGMAATAALPPGIRRLPVNQALDALDQAC